MTFQRLEAANPLSGGASLMHSEEVSRAGGLSAKAIRYDEDIACVRPARGVDQYRDFCAQDAYNFAFAARSGRLGISIEDGASADVNALATENRDRVVQKIDELQALEPTLETLVMRCHGEDCLDGLTTDNRAGREKPTA